MQKTLQKVEKYLFIKQQVHFKTASSPHIKVHRHHHKAVGLVITHRFEQGCGIKGLNASSWRIIPS